MLFKRATVIEQWYQKFWRLCLDSFPHFHVNGVWFDLYFSWRTKALPCFHLLMWLTQMWQKGNKILSNHCLWLQMTDVNDYSAQWWGQRLKLGFNHDWWKIVSNSIHVIFMTNNVNPIFRFQPGCSCQCTDENSLRCWPRTLQPSKFSVALLLKYIWLYCFFVFWLKYIWL